MELDFNIITSTSSRKHLTILKALTDVRLPAVMILQPESSPNGILCQLPESLEHLTLLMTVTTKKAHDRLSSGLRSYIPNVKFLRTLTIVWTTLCRNYRCLDLTDLCSKHGIVFSRRWEVNGGRSR
jgi:hypothetical protein